MSTARRTDSISLWINVLTDGIAAARSESMVAVIFPDFLATVVNETECRLLFPGSEC
jgi:hypothetical protein